MRSLPDNSPDSDAPELAELAAAARRSVNPPRLDRAGMATVFFVPPSAADTPPLVALNVKGDGVADALAEDDMAMRERGERGINGQSRNTADNLWLPMYPRWIHRSPQLW